MPAPVRLVAYADIPEPGHGINSVIGGGRDARQLSGGASQGIEARGWNELLERARG